MNLITTEVFTFQANLLKLRYTYHYFVCKIFVSSLANMNPFFEGFTTLSMATLSITTISIMTLDVLIVIMLSVIILSVTYAERHK